MVKMNWDDFVDTKKSGYKTDLTGFSAAEKANLVLADFAPGGLLPTKVANAFLVQAVLGSKFLTFINSDTYDAPSYDLPSAQFNGRVLYAGTDGQAVTAAQRSKPTFSKASMTFKLAKGQTRIDDSALENNIERSGLNDTIMGMLDEKVSAAIEEFAISADTTSSDPFLALSDGLLKRITSHTVVGDGTKLDRTKLETLYKTMPQQFRRDKSKLKFFSATDSQIDYVTSLGNRVGESADRRVVEGEQVPRWAGIPVEDIPLFPQNEGVGGNQSTCVLLDPKNVYIGFQRSVKFKTWRDEDAEQTVVSFSLKMDVCIAFEDATAKHTAIG